MDLEKSDIIFENINKKLNEYEYKNEYEKLTKKQKKSKQFWRDEFNKKLSVYPNLSINNTPEVNMFNYSIIYDMIKYKNKKSKLKILNETFFLEIDDEFIEAFDIMLRIYDAKNISYNLDHICNSVAKSCSLKMLKYILNKENISEETKKSIPIISSKEYNWNIVSWCLENNYFCTNIICTYIAEGENYNLLKKCIKKGLVWEIEDKISIEKYYNNETYRKYDTCILSAKNKLWGILKFAFENNNHLSNLVFTYIAESGNLEMLNWALKNKCPFDNTVFEKLALTGDLELLKWALQNKLPFGNTVFENLALIGDLKLLKWALKNKLPFSKTAFENLALTGDLELLKWALKNKLSYDNNILQNLVIIYKKEDTIKKVKKNILQVLEWLKKNLTFKPIYNPYYYNYDRGYESENENLDYYSYCCHGQGD